MSRYASEPQLFFSTSSIFRYRGRTPIKIHTPDRLRDAGHQMQHTFVKLEAVFGRITPGLSIISFSEFNNPRDYKPCDHRELNYIKRGFHYLPNYITLSNFA